MRGFTTSVFGVCMMINSFVTTQPQGGRGGFCPFIIVAGTDLDPKSEKLSV